MADVASWIVDGPDSDTSRSWLQSCKGQALGWWRDTTDVVVLNSPWLCRGTGRLFRCLTISLHAFLWTHHSLYYSDDAKAIEQFPARFCVMVVCLAASLCVSLMTSRESFGTSMLFGTGVLLSSNLFAKDRVTHHAAGIAFLPDFAMMCHCNVHPLVLCLGICDQLLSTWDTGITHVAAYSHIVSLVHANVFECAIAVAFTLDFTKRVKAVSSGILFGDGDELLESPVAGRSARIFCWVSGANQWFLFSATIIENECKFQEIGLAFFRNHLPSSSFAIPCISVGLVLLAQWSRCRIDRTSPRCRFLYMTATEWFNDFAFALFCCVPAVLMAVNFSLAHHHRDPFQLYWYDYLDEMFRRSMVLCITGVQTLVQGGCHPLICVKSAAICSLGLAWAWQGNISLPADGALRNLHFIRVYLTGMLLALSHSIDFFARMRAIQTGMLRSHQNAESSQMFLSSNGLELQSISAEALASDGSLDRLAAPSPAGPSAVVAVVRHAERADNMHSFDGWGCSKDAADFPHDPPITANGVEQAEQLADELKAEEMDFDVIFSSPFLRCLQTALILAEKFDTQVLIDQELGEVMGPPVFETEPPLPPRPWSNLKKTLEESEASSNLRIRLRAGRFMGKQPQWAETVQQARLRYVKRYLDYLRRSRQTKKNCLLVTHGHMVQACATVLPVSQHRKVVSVDYCGAAVAQCYKLGKTKNQDPHSPDGSQSTFFATESWDFQGGSREKDQLLQDAKTRYWTLRLRGVRTVPSSTPSGSNLQNMGQTWEDLVKLLGALPPVGPVPAPSIAESHGESTCSFASRTTATSVRMLREPEEVPKSPKLSEQTEQRQQSSSVQEVKVPRLAQPQLTLSTSRLAARRGLSKSTVPDTVPEDPV